MKKSVPPQYERKRDQNGWAHVFFMRRYILCFAPFSRICHAHFSGNFSGHISGNFSGHISGHFSCHISGRFSGRREGITGGPIGADLQRAHPILGCTRKRSEQSYQGMHGSFFMCSLTYIHQQIAAQIYSSLLHDAVPESLFFCMQAVCMHHIPDS